MAKQDDQQIDPERLGPSSTGVDENLSFDTSQDPARPEFDARPGTATSEFLLEGTPPQIGPVRPPTENPSRAASSVGSTPDALTGNPLARRDASRKKRAFVAYFSRQSTHGVRMEYARPTVADIALSSEGIKEMEKQWNKNAEIPYSHPPHFRWIHLPANNLEWVEGAVYRILHNIVRKKDENWKKENKFANDVRDQILRREYWADQQNKGFPDVHHSRFMRPFCRQISDAPKSASKLAANQHLIFMMPYLHWEITGMYKDMRRTIDGTATQSALSNNGDAEILKAYQYGPNAMHIRRTLDQSYYSTLRDTKTRDEDQVVQRYAEYDPKIPKAARPMLMVDQCWLWILGGGKYLFGRGLQVLSYFLDTVLTAFPQQWSGQDQDGIALDHTDILHNRVFEYLQDNANRAKVNDAKTFAYLIIDRCACNILDPDSITWPNLQFMRHFNDSIDDLMIAQTRSLKQLWSDVHDSKTKPVDDSMFDMAEDFGTLEKIKDIQEELLMLTHLLRQQKRSLSLLENEEVSPLEAKKFNVASTSNRGSFNRGRVRSNLDGLGLTPPRPDTSPSSHGHTASEPIIDTAIHDDHSGDEDHKQPKNQVSETLVEVLQRARERELDLLALSKKADSTYKALHDLLDLKQRQARLSEAKQARRSAQELEEQSNSIMLFTIVTILFLPLSSLASIFGINASDFGQGHITLARIFLYLFPISAFVVGVTFLLAFNKNMRKIFLLWLELLGTRLFLWFPTSSADAYVDQLQSRLDDMRDLKRAKPAEKAREKEEAALNRENDENQDNVRQRQNVPQAGRKRSNNTNDGGMV